MLSVIAIVPDSPAINPDDLFRAVMDTLDFTAALVKQDFYSTVESWNEKPEFNVESPERFSRSIFVENQIYSWVNNGTPPHEILPIRAHALHFFIGGHQAKTQPNSIGSGSGVPGDTEAFVRGHVNHPGITARNFDEIIANDYVDRFPKMMQTAIDEAGK